MAIWQLPPKVIEKRSDERDVFTLLNALRAAVQGLTAGGTGGRALFSTKIGRGDVSTDHSGNELLVDQWELPAVYDSFSVLLACRGSDSVSTATFRVRLGGTWNVATDGSVIASAFANSSSMVRRTGTGTVAAGNTATLMKVTMQSSALNHTAQFAGGAVVCN